MTAAAQARHSADEPAPHVAAEDEEQAAAKQAYEEASQAAAEEEAAAQEMARDCVWLYRKYKAEGAGDIDARDAAKAVSALRYTNAKEERVRKKQEHAAAVRAAEEEAAQAAAEAKAAEEELKDG